MLNLPNNYNEIKAQTPGEGFTPLAPGAYILIIKKAVQENSQTGKYGVSVYYDIAEGESMGFYMKQYELDKAYATAAKPAPWRGKVWFDLEPSDEWALPKFKQFTEAVEASNSNFKFSGDETSLAGKLVGVAMREEEYETANLELRTIVRPASWYSIIKVKSGEVPVPKRKELKKLGGTTTLPTTNSNAPGIIPGVYAQPTAQYAPIFPGQSAPAQSVPTAPAMQTLQDDEELPF